MPAVTSPPGYLPAAVLLTTNFTGALLIGVFFSLALMGVIGHMAYVYYDRYPKDRLIFKATVAFVVFVNLLHAAFISVYEYENLIIGFGDISTLTDLKWGITSSFTLSAVVACVVEMFYAYRVYALLGRNLVLPVIISILGLAGVVFSVYLTIRLTQIGVTFPTPWIVEGINWLYGVSFALPAAADILIVASMIFGLWRTHKLELPRSSWRKIRRVVFYAIETNLVSTVLYLVAIAMFAKSRRPISFAICWSLPRVFSITLISSLLSRQPADTGIKGDYEFDASESTSAPTMSQMSSGRRFGTQSHAARGVRIACTTQTVVEKDGVLEMMGREAPAVPASAAHSPKVHDIHWTPSSSLEKDDSLDDVARLSYV